MKVDYILLLLISFLLPQYLVSMSYETPLCNTRECRQVVIDHKNIVLSHEEKQNVEFQLF